jgi:hypothetical protein
MLRIRIWNDNLRARHDRLPQYGACRSASYRRDPDADPYSDARSNPRPDASPDASPDANSGADTNADTGRNA